MGLMKEELLSELRAEADVIYEAVCLEKKEKMLFIIPDLKLSGALTVFLELLELFDKEQYNFYVISSEDGIYRERFLEIGATVIIRPYVLCSEKYRKLLQEEFDHVFINSAACYYYVYYFLNTKTKVTWWFHETQTQLKTMQTDFLNLRLLSSNIRVIGTTKRVRDDIWELYRKEIELLPMPIKDMRSLDDGENYEEILFFVPAAFTYIKGQDVLLKAISMLPLEYQKKSKFVFCGYQLTEQNEYYEKIKNLIQVLPNTVLLGELAKEEVYEWYKRSDCIIAPSRVDSGPATIVEAMMFQKICIVSNATGIAQYMQDCINGFVFPSENVEELFKRLLLVIANREELEPIAVKGRKVYEDNFSPEFVKKQLKQIMI